MRLTVPADSLGGLGGRSVCPQRDQELADPHSRPGLGLSDPHHQGDGETADDCW